MTVIWAETALLENGWAENVRVEIDESGAIRTVDAGREAEGNRVGVLLPAPVNCHSHAFQRAMAGLTEKRGPNPSDSFWTWRQLMFRFLDRLTPDHVEAIAAFVQMEMLEAGYSANVEFHYLHHQPGGAPYSNIAEMAERIAAAAAITGIGLTLLPVHYQYGGCDQRPLGPGQIRFGNTLNAYQDLHARSKDAIKPLPADTRIGVAPHSLRAVAPESLSHHAALAAGAPLHMHLAEQKAEVEEVVAALGKRPVEFVLDTMALDARHCFIHCTQMLPHETEGLAKSGAVAGLCPITESSLGDGIFDGVRWFDAGGAIAVGSDSNIRISLSEELRTLDYSQRLRDNSRAALASGTKSTGRRLLDAIAAGGASVSGRDTGTIAPGKLADLMALDADAVDLAGKSGDTLIDCYVFAGDDRLITDVWSAGRHMVREGTHVKRSEIAARYVKTMKELGEAL
ncbi:MAG: formimidoylglutamate deiminase [Hoeflea sp.]|uniref:formimidoylglutamate deiminase n=1 Tax=Hoeflea sp. TaxID=1940281 RepID=UPI0032EE0FD4